MRLRIAARSFSLSVGSIGAFFLAAGPPARLAAQVPDTAATDTLARDTTDYSALFLRSQEEARIRVPTLGRLNRPDLLPALSRRVFGRDSIEWSNAATLGDLLARLPGVYLRRGGWIGQPELPSYQSRGAGSVEYLLDGIPLLALGRDSVATDPSLFPMSFLDRVEVERLPGLLRVHLFTRRHDRLPPRTRVSVASGDLDIARYQGLLERRGREGVGVVVAAEHLGVPLSVGEQGSYSNTQAWLQASWVPSPRFAASVQLFRAGIEREAIFAPGGTSDTLSAGLDGRRTDLHATVTVSSDSGGTGSSLSLLLGYSSWREDSTELSLPGPIPPHRHVHDLDQGLGQAGLLAAHRTRTSSLEGAVWYRSRWTPLEVRGAAATAPAAGVSARVDAIYRRHDHARTSRWVEGRGGLELPLGVQATGLVRLGSLVQTPAFGSDRPADLADWAGLLSFERPVLGVELGLWRTARSTPAGYSLYRELPALGPASPARWVTANVRLAPRQWFVLDGWYSDAIGAGPEGQPPTHSVINATIQSRFLRQFRSGIFGLKVQGTMETWGTGVLGRDAEGDPVVHRGATFFRGLIQLQLGGFTAYYDRVNLQASRLGYMPGLPQPRFASTFGVRWEFSN